MAPNEPETNVLIDRAKGGDRRAREKLLTRHRDRLKRMVLVRLDRRLAARVDPSDVVQEALADAARQLSDYLRDQPVAFYPWLRRLAWEHLVRLHQQHLQAGKRSVRREERWELDDDSAVELAKKLLGSGTSPSRHLLREELRRRVRAALDDLSERDREVLVLRYLEGLSVREAADVLGIREGAAKVRHLRALERGCAGCSTRTSGRSRNCPTAPGTW
jgi:RNA polymerase sigma-70 factor (ECF subfamily)